ncbi:aquaporin [Pedobacter sp. N36a]|uniref:aquaporin n=1 Tax=Pedobacter sp. N36a TaxID=2767996 RepID=UPI00351C4BFC
MELNANPFNQYSCDEYLNPARSNSQALFVGGEAVSQLWLFWAAPIAGTILAGLVYKAIFAAKP